MYAFIPKYQEMYKLQSKKNMFQHLKYISLYQYVLFDAKCTTFLAKKIFLDVFLRVLLLLSLTCNNRHIKCCTAICIAI